MVTTTTAIHTPYRATVSPTPANAPVSIGDPSAWRVPRDPHDSISAVSTNDLGDPTAGAPVGSTNGTR